MVDKRQTALHVEADNTVNSVCVHYAVNWHVTYDPTGFVYLCFVRLSLVPV